MQPVAPSPIGYRFGVFQVDIRAGELRKNGLKVKLQRQPFQVLLQLLENSPNIVGREELRKHLWDEETFVEFDHGLSNAIGRIRDALGDSAENARFIETLPKRGYRFMIPVEEVFASSFPAGVNSGANGHGTPAETPSTAEEPQRVVPAWLAHAPATSLSRRIAIAAIVAVLAGLVATLAARHEVLQPVRYTQITNFDDAAFSPAISPDGRMVAFIRGSDINFPTVGQIYVKLLSNGEPVQLTHDGWPKYGVTFSPDGSQIAYTSAENRWNTVSVPALGGEPHLLLPNAAGLTWLDKDHVMFSEIKTGLHMGLVTATTSRSELRDIYLPEHERGMAHYSFLSPDRKWVLVVEMGGTGAWQRCRLVPFDGSSSGSQVGPDGPCASAGWSPDGKWMYFGATVNGLSHLWRQRFPNGDPQQLTSGATEEAGVAIAKDGRSVISAVGMRESGVWLHDLRGEHAISSEGYTSLPSFSRDGALAYYLLRRESPESPQELWAIELQSGKSHPVIEGFSITSYDVSPDGKNAVFAARSSDGGSQLWLASCDRAFAPRMLASGGDHPFFGNGDDVFFRASEGGKNFLFRMKREGSQRTKVMQTSIISFKGMSPDRRWALVTIPVSGAPPTAVVAIPFQGGPMRTICPAECMAKWSPDGARFYVWDFLQDTGSGMTVVMPVPKGKGLPDLPAAGIRSSQDSGTVRGSTVLDLSGVDPSHSGVNVAPGLTEGTFIYAKSIVHRNLFQIPLP
jgi:DNA-binding winged helix-turn-helix (wHTH) protein/Tol biopolymer transport system component